MDVPAISLSFLADFTNAQGTARAALVEQQYRQRMQEGDRFWTFYYADVFAAAEQVVTEQGDLEPLRRAVSAAPEKKKRSYAAVAQGLATILTKLKPIALKRGTTALWQDPDSDAQIRVRPHFIATLPKNAQEAWFLNCKEEQLAAPAADVILHLMQKHGPVDAQQATPRLINVRSAQWQKLRANANRERIEQSLSAEAQTYRSLWLANSRRETP